MANQVFLECAVVTFLLISGTHTSRVTLRPWEVTRTKLLNKMFDPATYDKRIIPVKNDSERLDMTLQVYLFKLYGVSTQEGYMDIMAGIWMAWTDYRLGWNRSDINLRFISIDFNAIWKPEIITLTSNSPGNGVARTNLSRSDVRSSGKVYLIYYTRIKSNCMFDVYNFPYDETTCTVLLALEDSENYINLTLPRWVKNGPRTVRATKSYCGWDLISVEDTKIQNDSFPNNSFYQMKLRMKRSSEYMVYAHIVPVVMVAMAVPLQYLLEPDSSERIYLGGTLFVAMVFMITSLRNALPGGYLVVPKLVMYHGLTLIWIMATLLTSFFSASLSQNEFAGRPVPYTMRKLFLVHLRRLLCIGGDTDPGMDAISFRKFEKQQSDHYKESNFEQPMIRNRFENNIDMIRKAIKTIRSVQDISRSREHNLKEWQQVALIVDRLFFLLFVAIYVIYSSSLIDS